MSAMDFTADMRDINFVPINVVSVCASWLRSSAVGPYQRGPAATPRRRPPIPHPPRAPLPPPPRPFPPAPHTLFARPGRSPNQPRRTAAVFQPPPRLAQLIINLDGRLHRRPKRAGAIHIIAARQI